MLVLADANVPRAVEGALWAGCAGAGQARGSVERVYVEREAYGRFVDGLVEGARSLSVGDPSKPGTRMGPLASQRRLEHVRQLVDEAVAQGAQGALRRTARDPAGGVRRRLLRPHGAHRRDARNARDARAARRPRAGGDERRGLRAGDRARQRRRLRPRRVGMDGGPLPRPAHRARLEGRDGLAQRPPPRTRPSRAAPGAPRPGAASGARSARRVCAAARRRSSSPGIPRARVGCGGRPTTPRR